MRGYCGKLLRVDLETGSFVDVPLSPEIARQYIGGSGLAAHFFLEEVAPCLEAAASRHGPLAGRPDPAVGHPDPLGPENPLIFMTGPLSGMRLPTAARFTVSARSPLTGIWGESNVGGFFGPELKFAGYDGVIVIGRAAAPVYLLLDRGRPSLEAAAALWGKDTYEVSDVLAARHTGEGLRRPQSLVIGPAGENLVRFASINHGKHHSAGRTGMGAVMGAKKLKAVVVRGEGTSIAAADPEGLKALAGVLLARAEESMMIKTLSETGTIASMDLGGAIGDVPVDNWRRGEWDGLMSLGTAFYGDHLTGTATCFACPTGCFRKVTVSSLGRELKDAAGAEYETLAMLGANLLIDDLPAVQVAGDICNRLGLDTISAGATLAYAYEAADKGLLDCLAGGGTDRLKGAWGDAARLSELLEDIGFRRGIGAELAEGSAALARKIGRPEAEDFLVAVKGLEAPAHDPRAAHGMGIAYATGNRGACHMSAMTFNLELTGYVSPEVGLDYDGVQQVSAGKGILHKAAEDFGCVFGQAAVLCHLGGIIYTGDDVLAAINAATGFGYTMGELLQCGARIWHLKRAIGNLYGVRRADDRLPSRLLEVFEDGGAAGSVPDMGLMLAEWYEARGLDQSGMARPEVLEELGLGRVSSLLRSMPAVRTAGH